MIAVTGSTLKFCSKGGDEGEWCYREREDGEQGPFAVVRDEDRKSAAVGDASNGAYQIVARHLHRVSQARLRHD
jgi:hypothetical protein